MITSFSKNIFKYVIILLLIILGLIFVGWITTKLLDIRYHPMYPIGGERKFIHYVASVCLPLVPVLLGVILGLKGFYIERNKAGRWNFNGYLFIIVGLPMLIIPVTQILIHLWIDVP